MKYEMPGIDASEICLTSAIIEIPGLEETFTTVDDGTNQEHGSI